MRVQVGAVQFWIDAGARGGVRWWLVMGGAVAVSPVSRLARLSSKSVDVHSFTAILLTYLGMFVKMNASSNHAFRVAARSLYREQRLTSAMD